MAAEARKVLDRQVREALRSGWDVKKTGSGHLRFKNPAGTAVVTPSTPGKGRSQANSTANLRRAGLGAAHDQAASAQRERARREAKRRREQRAVLESLKAAVGWVTPDQVAEATMLDVIDVEYALGVLLNTCPEIDVDKDRYAYDPPFTTVELLRARRREAEAQLDLAMVKPEDLAELAATATRPEGVPVLFESVTADRHSRLLLRDENGKLWLALPVS